jgi:hypothetical protein
MTRFIRALNRFSRYHGLLQLSISVGLCGPRRSWNAKDKNHVLDAVAAFRAAYGAKFPKATAKLTDDREELLAFYESPAEHWIHLRTTNPMELTFVRHRTKVTRGPAHAPRGW